MVFLCPPGALSLRLSQNIKDGDKERRRVRNDGKRRVIYEPLVVYLVALFPVSLRSASLRLSLGPNNKTIHDFSNENGNRNPAAVYPLLLSHAIALRSSSAYLMGG